MEPGGLPTALEPADIEEYPGEATERGRMCQHEQDADNSFSTLASKEHPAVRESGNADPWEENSTAWLVLRHRERLLQQLP